jgi:hypothetical protein
VITEASAAPAGRVPNTRPRFKSCSPPAKISEVEAEHPHHHQDTLRVRKVLETADLMQRPLSRSFALRLLAFSRNEELRQWIESLPEKTLSQELNKVVANECPFVGNAMTVHRTARRSFEVSYWQCQLITGCTSNMINA